ncbi:MAG: hypothetical protein C4526_02060 [Nitrospiraceae bacterium]|nr:MAG: hypothetical protein C4526_02060 [Nitrospiraceae bacterium]
MKKPYIIHPFLFALYPVLFLYSHNINEIISIKVPVISAAVILLFAILFFLLLNLFLRETRKSGILISFFFLFFFSYGHIFFWIRESYSFGSTMIRNRYFLSAWVLLFTIIVFFVWKSRRTLIRFTNLLNAMSVLLIVLAFVNVFIFKFKERYVSHDSRHSVEENTDILTFSKTDKQPDIYYIILDRYCRADSLKEVYGYDNNEFLNYLTDKGFYVADQSRSNYMTTAPSLSSSLNMEHVFHLKEEMGTDSRDFTMLYAMLRDYKVLRLLKSAGYKYVHVGDYWRPTSFNPYADLNINYYIFPRFATMLYQTTVLYPISVAWGIYDPRMEHWQRTLYKLNKLVEIPKIKEPTFVFAHILVPHTPYVFDRNGNFLTEEVVEKRNENYNYLEQLIFINHKIKELIDKLLSTSEIVPIIILQSDEGSYPMKLVQEKHQYNIKRATKIELKQKMSILNAYFLPGVNKSILYPSITPVNSFRVIFNLYFKGNFKLLPDDSYVNEIIYPYSFYKITDDFEIE